MTFHLFAPICARIMATKIETPPKVGMVSLGCPKALVDSERILTRLRAESIEIPYPKQDLYLKEQPSS